MQWFRGITLSLAAGLMLSQAFRASALDLSSISGPAIVEQVPTTLTQQEKPTKLLPGLACMVFALQCAVVDIWRSTVKARGRSSTS